MKYIIAVFFLFISVNLFSQNNSISFFSVSPLASYSTIWNDSKYSKCNTAANVTNLNRNEKEIIYILNLIRTNPALFTKTVLLKYPEISGQDYLIKDSFYFISLVNSLSKMEPLGILYPDNALFTSAKCHAYQSGITGYVGHERKTNDCKIKKKFNGECCDYGNSKPLDIILSLLIDKGVPSLGHRFVCLSNYSLIGVSIQPHSRYGHNAVLDFAY
jgi:uncharacterized protein YkwD